MTTIRRLLLAAAAFLAAFAWGLILPGSPLPALLAGRVGVLWRRGI